MKLSKWDKVLGWCRWQEGMPDKVSVLVAHIDFVKEKSRDEYFGKIYETKHQISGNKNAMLKTLFYVYDSDIDIIKLKLDIKLHEMGYTFEKIGA